MTFLEIQFEYLAVKEDLWFTLEVTLIFLDIDLDHFAAVDSAACRVAF